MKSSAINSKNQLSALKQATIHRKVHYSDFTDRHNPSRSLTSRALLPKLHPPKRLQTSCQLFQSRILGPNGPPSRRVTSLQFAMRQSELVSCTGTTRSGNSAVRIGHCHFNSVAKLSVIYRRHSQAAYPAA